ncbi:MAG: triose-phosphate isomerase [Candidatus Thermoplasmatota archaeon]|nr:triose-phosphate isomerase [Candidatus Thermoplasmatota archaeon]
MVKTPVVVLNVKTYTEATGASAVELTHVMKSIVHESGVSMAIAVQACDITSCVNVGGLPVYAQHVDPIQPGSHTGWTLPEAVKAAGAVGTLINHSEHRLILADIDACISRAKHLHLDTLVCTNNVATSQAVATFAPDMIAVEPPELIGGDISVTTADPDVVSRSVKAVHAINTAVKVLCGAGVKNGGDVAKAIELGADGVLLASGVVKAKDKEAVLRDLISHL